MMNNKIDFNDYAEDYAKILQHQLKFFDAATEYFSEYKVDLVRKYVSKPPRKILEYGCGIGRNLKFLSRSFPDSELYGCDISAKSLAIAAKENPKVKLFLSGKDIVTDKFDLVFVALVFHHIERAKRLHVLQEIRMILPEQGELFIFEHNPYNPVTRHLVNTCPFDADAVLLTRREMAKLLAAAGFHLKMGRYALFFPTVLKKLRFLEAYLGAIPLGGQYFLQASPA